MPPASVTRRKDADQFRKASKEYVARVTTSPQAARKALVELGIYTAKGNLAKNYK
jgi:hypothetical protein